MIIARLLDSLPKGISRRVIILELRRCVAVLCVIRKSILLEQSYLANLCVLTVR